ncbi:putative disease resistance protein RGA3 [Lactuca sativa]|uniref:Disease resistance protein RGA3 n=1 Tax=Lactuca sativa TaxID=4236 RepID=A0A9R1XNY6_LACSA|nr:putative disease resistance protein RGA3 [Lactuca sativa]KAJ0220251.1 hypothetical protein LSAT_V11C200060300 [Lactuca sativa]
MADALVIIAADVILKKVASIAANEIALAWGYKTKLQTLEQTLKMIRAKLQDAENQKGQKHGVMEWLKQLKHVVGEADDVVDEVHYEMLRREVKKRDRVGTKVPSLPSMKKLLFGSEMGHKIKNINEKLSQINKAANELGLQNEQPGPVVQYRPYPETNPNLGEIKIFGREEDEERIIHLLTESRKEEKLTIVPIVGMGGIGKTTLAKSVFNNSKIQQHFDVKAWLCVSVKVDINTLLAKIYESVVGEKPKSETMANLVQDLEKKLGAKRYLLVLDDVWNEERLYWEDFSSVMINVKSQIGSSILVTTRKLDIGTKAMAMDSCPLKCLSNNHCWYIFKERAFLAGQSPQPELEEIGRDIIKKCRGLPLLLNVIGGMLQNYSDPEKWLAIKNSKVWDLEDERERVQKSLELSFDNLPNSMAKQCFTYCSIFEKDTLMEREELVQLWMALGLVQADEERNKEMEDVGNDIFQILVNNSLFEDVKKDEYGHIINYGSMHDLVHDLSLSLSKHDSLCLVDATNDDIACIPQAKHLAFYQEENEDDEFNTKVSMFIEKNTMARSLHTLFIKGEVEKKFSFQRLKCIRILKLNGYGIKKLDDSIGGLVHLRYLKLSSTPIRVLPESIGKLYHLQTLKLQNCYHLNKFPESMKNLISLRFCKSEESIPNNIVGQLTSLRTLMPNSLGMLRNDGHGIKELSRLKHLSGKLCISNLENISSKQDAVMADLSGKKNLNEIDFNWSTNYGVDHRNDKEVLGGLQPPGGVKILRIRRFSGDNFPEWVMKMAINIHGKETPLDKLVDITLSGCWRCLSLPMLEHLPHLRDLKLEKMDSLTCLRSSNVTGSTKPLSPSLRSLRLYNMKRLEKWIDGAPNSSKMISPVLQSFVIRHCPKIILLDECHPHPLVSLEILGCNGLVSINSIQGLTSLESLEISYCQSLLEISNLPNQCHSLKTLQITDCYKLTSLPHEMFDCFAFLNDLTLGPFSKELDSFPSLQGIQKLRNHLHSLELRGWDHWDSMPEEIQHLTSLTSLTVFTISGFGMRELPMWSSIRHLRLQRAK